MIADFDWNKFRQAMSASVLFRNHIISWTRETASTSDDLKQGWAAAEVAQQIRIADYQTAGRGQHGRQWHALPGQALLFSFSLTDSQNRFPLSLIAGLAVYRALFQLASHDRSGLWLKWPNDVWFNHCKLAGILCEGCLIKNRQHWIVGIGINLLPLSQSNVEAASFSELSDCHDPQKILCEFFAVFEDLLSADAEILAKSWSLAASLFWQTRFLFAGIGEPDFIGLPEAVDADGALLVIDDSDKKSRRLLSATLKPLF